MYGDKLTESRTDEGRPPPSWAHSDHSPSGWPGLVHALGPLRASPFGGGDGMTHVLRTWKEALDGGLGQPPPSPRGWPGGSYAFCAVWASCNSVGAPDAEGLWGSLSLSSRKGCRGAVCGAGRQHYRPSVKSTLEPHRPGLQPTRTPSLFPACQRALTAGCPLCPEAPRLGTPLRCLRCFLSFKEGKKKEFHKASCPPDRPAQSAAELG